MRAPTIFPAIALTGGTTGALDAFSLDDLQDGDGAIVMCTDYTYSYTFDADNSEVESSPDIITPDDAGVDDGRWVLTKSYIANNSDKLSGNIDSDFAAAVHGEEHFLAGDDPISLATSTKEGLMGMESMKRVWAPGDFRNLIINGNMCMWQRGTGASSATGYVTADRWRVTTPLTIPVCQRTTLTLGAIDSQTKYALRVNTGADALAAAYQAVIQRIESVLTCANKRVTLSFWTYCTTDDDISVSLQQDFGTGGSPSSAVNITPISGESGKCAMSAEWTEHVLHFDVPSISGKTLGSNGDDFLAVIFWFSAGSDWNALTDSLGHQEIQAYLTNVQLEEGYLEEPVFENRPPSIEALLCFRYYWRSNNWYYAFPAYADNCRGGNRVVPPVQMRITPTCSSVLTNASLNGVDTLTFTSGSGNDTNGGWLYCLSTGVGINCYFQLGSGDYVALSAEL